MQPDNHVEATDPDTITLKEFIFKVKLAKNYLWSKWKIIVLTAGLGAAIGLAYAYLTKPVYIAALSFVVDDDKSSGGGLSSAMGLASQFGIDLGGGGGSAFTGDNLIGLMRSRSMVEKTLLSTVTINGKQETLASLYISFNKLAEQWEKDPALKNISFPNNSDRSRFTLAQDSVLGTFYKSIIKNNLVVDKEDKKLSITTITVSSKNELFSKYFAEEIVKTVSDFYVATKTKKSAQNLNILQRQTDSVRRELNKAISGVASSNDVNPNANPLLQVLRVPSQHRQVDVQANTAILNQLVANLELAKVSLRKETPLIQEIDGPILPLEKKGTSRLISLIVGGFLGLLLSTLFIAARKGFKLLVK